MKATCPVIQVAEVITIFVFAVLCLAIGCCTYLKAIPDPPDSIICGDAGGLVTRRIVARCTGRGCDHPETCTASEQIFPKEGLAGARR